MVELRSVTQTCLGDENTETGEGGGGKKIKIEGKNGKKTFKGGKEWRDQCREAKIA